MSLYNAPEFNYTLYQYTYRAVSSVSMLVFGFYHEPSYWCLDDVSMTRLNSTNNLIVSGGFENGYLYPFALCTDLITDSSGTAFLGYAQTGLYSYRDGSTQIGDFMWQAFLTVPQKEYTISFSLRNLGMGPNSAYALLAAVDSTGINCFLNHVPIIVHVCIPVVITTLTSTTTQRPTSTSKIERQIVWHFSHYGYIDLA